MSSYEKTKADDGIVNPDQRRRDLASTNTMFNTSEWQQDQQHYIDKSLKKTQEFIRKSVDEAKKEIPRYTRAINEYQEQTIESTRQLADNFVVSQKEIINSYQSAWAPYVETYTRNVSTLLSLGRISEVYTNTTRSFADNLFTVTRLTNNVIFGYAEAFKYSLQQAKNNVKELSRIGVSLTKSCTPRVEPPKPVS